jgi:hypothetical protein
MGTEQTERGSRKTLAHHSRRKITRGRSSLWRMSSWAARGVTDAEVDDDELCRFGLKMRTIMAATISTRSRQMHCLRPALRWYLQMPGGIRINYTNADVCATKIGRGEGSELGRTHPFATSNSCTAPSIATAVRSILYSMLSRIVPCSMTSEDRSLNKSARELIDLAISSSSRARACTSILGDCCCCCTESCCDRD